MSSSIFQRVRVVVLLAAIGLVLAACKSDTEKVADFLELGDEYAEQGQDREAVIEYRNVLQIAPNDPAALVGRAASFLAMDRPWEATNDLDRALRMQTRLAGADVAAAGDETTANQRRRRHDGEAARTRLLRGHAHAACLRYDRAVADFAEAEAILSRLGGSTDRSQPTPAHAQAGLGVAYCNMRDWQRCVDAGERAVRSLPLDDVARRPVHKSNCRGASHRSTRLTG